MKTKKILKKCNSHLYFHIHVPHADCLILKSQAQPTTRPLILPVTSYCWCTLENPILARCGLCPVFIPLSMFVSQFACLCSQLFRVLCWLPSYLHTRVL